MLTAGYLPYTESIPKLQAQGSQSSWEIGNAICVAHEETKAPRVPQSS